MRSLAFIVFSSLSVSIHSQVSIAGPIIDGIKDKELPCPVRSDNVAYCRATEHHMNRGDLMATLPRLGKEGTVSLEFKPIQSTQLTEQANIIHLLDIGRKASPFERNDGIFAIMTKPDQHLHFSIIESSSSRKEKVEINLDYGTYYYDDGERRANVMEVGFSMNNS